MVRFTATSAAGYCFPVLVPLLVCFLWGACLKQCIASSQEGNKIT